MSYVRDRRQGVNSAYGIFCMAWLYHFSVLILCCFLKTSPFLSPPALCFLMSVWCGAAKARGGLMSDTDQALSPQDLLCCL